MFVLRDYQQEAVAEISDRFSVGLERVMVSIATGGGKGVIMGHLAKKWASLNRKVLTITRRRSVVYQTQKIYEKQQGIQSSVIMGTERVVPSLNYIASVDTIIRRYRGGYVNFIAEVDYVIIDEAHDTTSINYLDVLGWLHGNGKRKKFVGFTGTPYNIGLKGHTWWDKCIEPIKPIDLLKRKMLCPIKAYSVPSIDTDGIAIRRGDYVQDELVEASSSSKIVGDIADHYNRLSPGNAALLFCININHSKLMAEKLNERGVKAAHIDQSSDEDSRQLQITKLKYKEISILSNVGILSTGVDVPFVETVIFARPTMSLVLWLQMLGRVLRPFKKCLQCGTEYGADSKCYHCGSSLVSYEKKEATIIDHSGNYRQFGGPYMYRKPVMRDIVKRETSTCNIPSCGACHYIFPKGKKISPCPMCGDSGIIKEEENYSNRYVDGTLVEVQDEPSINDHAMTRLTIAIDNHVKSWDIDYFSQALKGCETMIKENDYLNNYDRRYVNLLYNILKRKIV